MDEFDINEIKERAKEYEPDHKGPYTIDDIRKAYETGCLDTKEDADVAYGDLHMAFLSQVALWKSAYDELKVKYNNILQRYGITEKED